MRVTSLEIDLVTDILWGVVNILAASIPTDCDIITSFLRFYLSKS